MRLDRFLCEMKIGSRSRIKTWIRQGLVSVNGTVALNADRKIDELSDKITFRGKVLYYQKYVYYMLNKPAGVVSAVLDNTAPTVVSLLEKDGREDIFPIGRLDKDARGLLLLTNDGELAHKLLSPRRHVDKTYRLEIRHPLTEGDIVRLEQGIDIGEEKPTLPARVEIAGKNTVLLTIHEGKFHQVKRMLQALGNEVLALERISFGGLSLDGALKPGEYRKLTSEEVALLGRSADKEKRDFRHEMLRDIDAVIFDLDGSLVDSMWLWKAIDIEYLGRFHIPMPTDLQSQIEGMSFGETARYFKEHFAIPDPLEKIMDDWNRMAWDKYTHEVPLKCGIPEFLEGCRENGILLGIATSNSRELVENIAGTHKLKDYFSCIMTGSDVARGKPSPDIYLAVAGQLGVLPEKCLVFEDIIPGIQAGKNAGMRVCAVEDAYSIHVREEKKRLADYYIEDYTDLW